MKKITSFVLSVLMVFTMFSCLATVVSAAGKPATPSLVSVQNATSGIVFKWKKVANADFYRVYRRIGSGGWKVIGKAEGASYTDKTAKSGTTYKYTVKAVDDGVASGFKSGLSIIRLSNPASIKVKNVSTGVTVTWAKVNGATGYRVYRKLASAKSYTYLGNTTKLTYTDKTAKSGKTYQYTVKATYGKTYSGHNAGAKIMYLSAPVFTSKYSGGLTATISWSAVEGAEKYRVYRRIGTGGWKLIATVKTKKYVDKTLVVGKNYKFTVKAVSGDYVSGYNNNGKVIKITDAILADPLGAYQKASQDIRDKGAAGYTKRSWQTLEGNGIELNNTYNTNIEDILDTLMRSFFVSEEEAPMSINVKGSEDATRRMYSGNCLPEECKATARKKDNGNYVITIVMNDQVNPLSTDESGLAVMCKNIVFMDDVENIIKNDPTVSKVVYGIDNNKIKYDDFTIVAEMTKDGKFVSITQDGCAVMTADVKLAGLGKTSGSCDLSFHARYTDFKY